MLRTKSKKISEIFTSLGVLCLWLCLILSLRLAPTHAQPQRKSASAPSQTLYYIVDVAETPGAVYRIENREPDADDFFKRPSGSISSIALCNGQLYFCSDNDRRIYQRTGKQQERVVFEYTTYIRDVAVDPNGNLYFSVASGPKGDGRIYQLTPSVNNLEDDGRFSIATDSQSRPVQVRLSTVDKFWEGDFTFDEQSNLYLSSGNHIPAFIYRVPKNPNGVHGRPQKVYRDSQGAIKGIAMPNIQSNTRQDFIYYADWRQTIYKLNIRDSRRSREFSGNVAKSRNPHLSDIAFDIRSP